MLMIEKDLRDYKSNLVLPFIQTGSPATKPINILQPYMTTIKAMISGCVKSSIFFILLCFISNSLNTTVQWVEKGILLENSTKNFAGKKL